MDRREVDRALKILSELEKHRKPFEPVLRYRPAGVERPDYRDITETEIKVFESAIEILLSPIATAVDHLKFDGWQQTRSPELADRIEFTRAIHHFNAGSYDRDIPGYDRESQLRRLKHIRCVYGAWAQPLSLLPPRLEYKMYIHPSSDEVLIQTVAGSEVAIFLARKYVPAALIGLQCDFIKHRFTSPVGNQSSSYSVNTGGRKISGSLTRHSRDTFDDYQFEARVGDSFPPSFDSWKEQFFFVFAEMRTIWRSL
ncbi:hypothetical protein RLEG12_23075 [Rhizobium leguminosarum bv. trifolii CB782]|nr:hypothetical protein RLEG12_23075 [Rhizobium leguminosarum bv. trifolii CB782]EJC76734.1 hypothetical protein Rleg10DRAFT_5419 [Rhizobium leguminosarum bv. trifolii WSM2012]